MLFKQFPYTVAKVAEATYHNLGRSPSWMESFSADEAAAIRGSSSEPEVDTMVQVGHLLLLGLDCQIWIEWIVPDPNRLMVSAGCGLLDEWTRSRGRHLQNASIHLGTKTRMHQLADSTSCGRTTGFAEVGTLDM